MSPSLPIKVTSAAGCVLAAGWVTDRLLLRPGYVHWGATAEEASRRMLLDERVPSPSLDMTLAIGIKAAPEDIWPWIAQIGDPPRGGYYSYTWIERLVGLRIRNADTVLEEYQHPKAGEALDRNGTMVVQAVEPGKSFVLGPPPSVEWISCTWAFGLYPNEASAGVTRLVARIRGRWSWRQMLANTPPMTWPLYLLIKPGAFVMQRKMLLEIRRRAEKMASVRRPDAVAVQQAPAPPKGS